MDLQKKIDLQKVGRVVLLVIADIVAVNLSQFLALFVRCDMSLDGLLASEHLESVVRFAPAATALTLLIFTMFRLYSSLWAYASVKEALRVGEASFLSSLLHYTLATMLRLSVPRSFPILNCLFLAFLTVTERFGYRMLRTVRQTFTGSRNKARTMLIGAGAAGDIVLRELMTSSESKNRVVCIIDDMVSKSGRSINGVPIVGTRKDIPAAVEKYRVEEIIFAIPSCRSSDQREIMKLCQQTGCQVKVLPGLMEIANGGVTIQKLRRVSIEDLLGRETVRVDLSGIGAHIRGKTVLVTGGGGSIGSELCRQIAVQEPRELIIFDIYENNAYDIQQELKRKLPNLRLTVLIGSVRDRARVQQLFAEHRPELVYHAAAHKHVPLMEDSPNEAIKNNVFGTYNVAEAADLYGAEAFVLISTDKAVNPTNIMGASKRICEMIVQMYARRSAHTRYVAVRFGNVLGSNGSVIPLFRRQIEAGGPVTVTHPDIIRYFMTIPEAVSLVMQAGVYAKGGEIFVLDMGEPVRIDDLARNMIRLSGLTPDEDIKIVYTGLRPGEKLYEELLMSEEGLEKTDNQLIFIGHPAPFSDEELLASLDRLKTLSAENSAQIRQEVLSLVSTYHPEDAPAPVRL